MGKRGRRDVSPIANDQLSDLVGPSVVRVSPQYLFVEDRRTFHPEGPQLRPFLMDNGVPATLTSEVNSNVKRKGKNNQSSVFSLNRQTKSRLVFAAPDRTLVCVRRNTRREVLFAKGRGGAGGKRRRHVRRNDSSNYGC